ncbi:MAG: hypothetical protein ILP13_03045 [Lachnospiraceae bacterium]|nr:hypothetical protein [Lachnospiraceae bacterium]
MPWCPVCKLEYVEGSTECPDCKVKLVDSLEEAEDIHEEIEEMEDAIEENFQPLMEEAPDEETMKAIYELRKALEEMPNYKAKSDMMAEHRSAAFALLLCGILGACALLLNAFGIIKLPVSGFSLTMVYVVMGLLFFIFLVCGVRSLFRCRELKPLVEKESELKEKILAFVNERKDTYKTSEDSSPEEAYLEKCKTAVVDVEAEFPDLEPGFAYYVVDRFAGDLSDED